MRILYRVAASSFFALIALFFAWPAAETISALRDPNLSGAEPVRQVWRWHRALTPVFAAWARSRIQTQQARTLSIHDISGTEWPLFGAVYYLRATENLDAVWQRQPVGERPAIYARAAIDAAAELLADPAQADWVQRHWGADAYLSRENVFYRMLLIDGLSSQWRVLGQSPHADLLRSQTNALASELSASETGLLADYPGQTFPADVAAAWHAIRRADSVLGTDHEQQASLGLRGFTGTMAPTGSLPPYAWYGRDPMPVRGCANSWLLHHAPFIWPVQAGIWFDAYHRDYWQAGIMFAGYREYRQGDPMAETADVDSGPIISNLGVAASAFGIGATRSVGRANAARALSLQAIAAAWPLPNGRLLMPWVMSDHPHAPYLGEAAMLYNLSQPVAKEFATAKYADGTLSVPGVIWLTLLIQFLVACGLAMAAIRVWIRPKR